MKKSLLVGLGLIAGLAGLSHAGGNAANQTGQGIMVNLKSSGTFAIDTTNIYRFDQEAAAVYFSNAWNGADPTVSCSGSACNGDLCGVPLAPGAPAPDALKVFNPGGSGAADKSRCTFLDGGTLTLSDEYTLDTAKVPVSCTVYDSKGKAQSKSAEYTFTYTYAVAPMAEIATVTPFTAWPLDQVNTSGLAHVNVDADIAGESVLVKNGSKKYSFSMLDNGINRVQNLSVTLDGVLVANPSSTIAYPVDFTYTTNAGSNGATAYLTNGDARTILNADNFVGNDNGGADGSALALATMQTVGIDVGPGIFTVGLTGSVKDNGATSSVAFDVTEALIIVTPGCGH